MKHAKETDRGIHCNACRERIYNVKNINHKLSDKGYYLCTTCAPVKEVKAYHYA